MNEIRSVNLIRDKPKQLYLSWLGLPQGDEFFWLMIINTFLIQMNSSQQSRIFQFTFDNF